MRMSSRDVRGVKMRPRPTSASPSAVARGWDNRVMKAKLVSFGHLEIDGEMYRKDVVVDGGKIRKRDKGPSKERYAKKWGHTPLTAAEEIPVSYTHRRCRR